MEQLPFSGSKLRARRLRAGLSQAQLGERAGCTQKTITSIELGKRVPHPGTAADLARALGTELAELCDEAPALERAAPGGVRRPDGLPQPPRDVVGREADLRALRALLGGAAAPTQRRALVHGWPGVGKTTLSLVAGHDPALRRDLRDGVLFTSLGQSPNVRAELAGWCRNVGVPDADLAGMTTEQMTYRLTHVIAGRRVLVIVDDVWSVQDLLPFLVGGPPSSMLVTTRVAALADELVRPSEVYRLAVLGVDRAVELLRTIVPDVVDALPSECAQLASALEGLPLALRVAGGLLRREQRRGFTITDLLRDMQADLGPIHRSAVPADLALGSAHSVAALLSRSTDVLDPLVRDRFAMLGVLVPKPAVFHEQLACAAWAAESARDTLGELVDRGLVESVGAKLYQIHALLAVHARTLLERGASEHP